MQHLETYIRAMVPPALRRSPIFQHHRANNSSLAIAILALLLTNFCAPFFKEIPSFFCRVTPSKTLAAPQTLNIAFPLGNGGVLRSEEGGGFRKEGDGGEGEKKGKKDAQKVLRLFLVSTLLFQPQTLPSS